MGVPGLASASYGITLAATLKINRLGISLLLAGLAVAFIASFCYWLSGSVISNRKSRESEGKLKGTGLGFLAVLVLTQAVATVAAVVISIGVIALAVPGKLDKEDPTLGGRLATRIEKFAAAKSETKAEDVSKTHGDISSFCTTHEKDDLATNVFAEACGAFAGSAEPDDETRGKLVKRLKKEDD